MSDWIIKAEGVGKKYRIRHEAAGQHYNTLRDVLANKAKRVFGKSPAQPGASHASTEDFWALKDVSFEIKPGDVVGIIGRNGAGKSTLLKLLSRITEATEGRMTLRGRVASLLEVGTGFHPELTGRENIFLNGAILGMTRSEIRRKFDEIIAFAEVEKFLDTPVKRYSSGMFVRLAFAVAAHLEPEILVVDEVLAVGDAEFQKKCLGKMQDVAGNGRTVLFVSHNMAAVRRLCTRGLVFSKGRLIAAGDTNSMIDAYLNSAHTGGEARQEFRRKPDGVKPAFASVEIRNATGRPQATILAGEPFEIAVTLHNPTLAPYGVIVGVELLDNDGVSLFTSHSDDVSRTPLMVPPGDFTATCQFHPNPLMPGNYSMQLGMVDRQWEAIDLAHPELSVRVDEVPHSGDHLHLRRPGRLLFKLPWKTNQS
jgi:lipopolysaccharide transport system ATP-binding protein